MAPRPKGYADWAPAPATLAVIDDVRQVLREYQAHLPLTVRQIFYRLVGQYGYDKTERAYSRLCEYLVRARRAQLIPFDAIRDDGTTSASWMSYSGPAAFWQSTKIRAAGYARDMLEHQPVHIELWCEAAGMVPQLDRVASEYSVPVYSTGGFSSVTVTYEIADRALARSKPTVFLHVGDYDPSGESIFEAMTEDARQFLYNRLVWKLGAEAEHSTAAQALLDAYWPGTRLHPLGELPPELPDLRPRRVALTEEQVAEYDLPTAPPKATDSRSAAWLGETCQAEAMPPDLLAEVVRAAIEAELDGDLHERVLAEEEAERDTITAQLDELLGADGVPGA